MIFNEIGPGICVKYFLSFPEKSLSPEKTETKCLLFNLSMIKFTIMEKKPFGTWQFGKIGVLVNH